MRELAAGGAERFYNGAVGAAIVGAVRRCLSPPAPPLPAHCLFPDLSTSFSLPLTDLSTAFFHRLSR